MVAQAVQLGLLALVTMVGGAAGEEAAAQLMVPTTGGSQVEYTGSWCKEFLSGKVVSYAGTTVAAQEATLDTVFGLLDSAANIVGDAKCTVKWKSVYCRMAFPAAVTSPGGNLVPQKQCKSECDALYSVCSDGFDTVKNVGYGEAILRCDDTIEPVRMSANYAYSVYPELWDKTGYFDPDSGATYNIPGEGSVAVPCWTSAGESKPLCRPKLCMPPYVEVRSGTLETDREYCESETQTKNGFDCDRCSSSCKYMCPLIAAVYKDTLDRETQYTISSTADIIWYSRWLPGIIAFPLNIAITISELLKLSCCSKERGKKNKAAGNVWVFITALLGLVYGSLDSISSAAWRYDLSCNGGRAKSSANIHGAPECNLLRFNVHMLQMIFASVGVTLFLLWRKIRAAATMKTARTSVWMHIAGATYVFVLPLVLALIHNSIEQSNGASNVNSVSPPILYNLDFANDLRFASSCGPRLGSLENEVAVVMAPLVIYGVFLIVACGLIASAVVSMAAGQLGKRRSSTGDASGQLGKRRSSTGDASGGVSSTTKTLMKTMTKFATACVLLVALFVGAQIPFLKNALQFSYDVDNWATCASAGINPKTCRESNPANCPRNKDITNITATVEFCGSFSASAPSAESLIAINLSLSLAPLIFGVLFGYQLVMSLISSATRKVSVTPSTAASSMAPAK